MTPDRLHYLDVSLISFEKSLRWGHIEGVAGFLPADKPIDTETLARYEQVEVGSYNTLSRSLNSDGNEATILVTIDYVDKESMRVYKATDRQLWKYDDEGNRWYLASPLPSLR